MAKSAAQIELKRMLDDVSHRSQHMPINICSNGDNDDSESDEFHDTESEEIASIYKRNFVKTFWYSNPIELFESLQTSPIVDSRGELIRTVYRVDPKMDYLQSNEIQIPLPAVSLKQKPKSKCNLRIAWTPNPGVNSIVEVDFRVGDIVINKLDTGAIDDYMKWGNPLAQNSIRDDSIGDVASLTSWNTSLPAKTCIFTLPMFYTYSGGSAFPLFLLDSQTQVTHRLTYWNSPIQELLRIEIETDVKGTKIWRPIAKKETYPYLVNHGKIHSPIFTGEYGMITAEEKEETYQEDKIAIPIHDMLTVRSPNTIKYGSAHTFGLESTDPVIAMFWKAVNVDAERRNNRTNYTTNPDDIRLGQSPISSTEFRYGETDKFRRSSDQLRSMNMLKVFPNVPVVNGYGAFAFSKNPFAVRGHTGVIFSNDPPCKLTCSFTDPSNIYSFNSINENANKSHEEIVKELLDKLDQVSVSDVDASAASSSSSPSSGSPSGFDDNSEDQLISKSDRSKDEFRPEVRLMLWKELQFTRTNNPKIYDFEYV